MNLCNDHNKLEKNIFKEFSVTEILLFTASRKIMNQKI